MSKTDIPYLGEVLNVTSGCTKISEGCANCYASRLSERFHGGPFDGSITLHPERLEAALHWRRPKRVGVCFTSDPFHKGVPDEFIDKVFAVMALTPQHTYMLLTKRPERMRAYLISAKEWAGPVEMPARQREVLFAGARLAPGRDISILWPLPNVWLGVSCENQRWADERIPLLLDTPAAHRWVSLEPLLGAISLSLDGTAPGGRYEPVGDRLDWCVVGGESGPHARPCDLGWIRDIDGQCEAAGVKRYIKQLGAKPMIAISKEGNRQWYGGAVKLGWRLQDSIGSSYYRDNDGNRLGFAFRLRDRKGENPDEWPPDLRVREWPEAR